MAKLSIESAILYISACSSITKSLVMTDSAAIFRPTSQAMREITSRLSCVVASSSYIPVYLASIIRTNSS